VDPRVPGGETFLAAIRSVGAAVPRPRPNPQNPQSTPNIRPADNPQIPKRVLWALLALGLPFVLAGALKAAYDLTLWAVFRHVGGADVPENARA